MRAQLILILWAALVLSGPAHADEAKPDPKAEARGESKPEAKRDNKTCLECHAEGVDAHLRVKAADFARAPHTEDSGVSCVGCHTKAATVKDITDHGKLGPASCEGCHDAAAKLRDNAHGHSARGGKLPDCKSCHGAGHQVRPVADAASPVSPARQLETCGTCHTGSVLTNYASSVHGRRLQRGQPGGPTCSTCHGGHAIALADITRDPTFKTEITRTCGSCHKKVFEEYQKSQHGTALLARNNYDSASCVDCHRSHEILPPSDPGSAVHATRVVKDCAGCHADARLIRRSHLPDGVVKSFELSYHGRAANLGSTAVANCSSCHEHHGIFRASDPRSSVHPQNLAHACGKCHPGAGKSFIQGKVHVVSEREQNYWAWFAKNTYFWMILFVIGGMVLHNLLDFIRKMLIRARQQRDQPHVVRMSRQERLVHVLVFTSFLTLVWTGFALLYPTAWWVAPLNWLGLNEALRKSIHRTSGAILAVMTLQHLWFLFFHRRGREQRRNFMPRLKDVRDLWDNLMFYLGRRKERPSFGRFTYMEKAEYWALVWGTGVMIFTGFVMWFQEPALRLMPRWLWEVCQVVHRYEAILAALAILVWHFYFIFINPDESPMSLTWLTGRMTLHELSVQHPEEFARLKEAERQKGAGRPQRAAKAEEHDVSEQGSGEGAGREQAVGEQSASSRPRTASRRPGRRDPSR